MVMGQAPGDRRLVESETPVLGHENNNRVICKRERKEEVRDKIRQVERADVRRKSERSVI